MGWEEREGRGGEGKEGRGEERRGSKRAIELATIAPADKQEIWRERVRVPGGGAEGSEGVGSGI